MACCVANSETKKSDAIDKELNSASKDSENQIKLLLLGAGESGKSTVAKQMKILHLDGFTEEEKKGFKTIIYNNVVSSMRTLIVAAKGLGADLESSSAKESAERVMSGNEDYFIGPITGHMAKDIKVLWANEKIQDVYSQSSKFQLNDSAAYYFESIDRISAEDFLPEEQDILRSRAKTTGIIEIDFKVENYNFKMVDVGGQRSERKKWMHCFQDVKAVIFCVALSEYDLRLHEDETTNRMHESIKLFNEICNSQWFVETAMILFLNKSDLFKDKIQNIDLNVCFPEYQGGLDFDAASGFIQEKFSAQNEDSKKPIYPHITCATDTENIKIVFDVVRDVFVQQQINPM